MVKLPIKTQLKDEGGSFPFRIIPHAQPQIPYPKTLSTLPRNQYKWNLNTELTTLASWKLSREEGNE